LDQSLLLRGSREFADLAAYECVFRPIVTGDFGIVTAHFGR
jgi:hypothetical protein